MAYSRLFYHFVWATKGRQPLISETNRGPIEGAILAKARDLRAIVHALGGTSDHVHMVVSLSPALAPASFIGQIKGASSHLAARLAPNDDGGFAWQGQYGVLSLTEAQIPAAVRYVQRQDRHHTEHTTRPAMEDTGEDEASQHSH